MTYSIQDIADHWVKEIDRLRAEGDFETADDIREALLEDGIQIENTPSGSRWRWVGKEDSS